MTLKSAMIDFYPFIFQTAEVLGNGSFIVMKINLLNLCGDSLIIIYIGFITYMYTGLTSCTFPPWTEMSKKNGCVYRMSMSVCRILLVVLIL